MTTKITKQQTPKFSCDDLIGMLDERIELLTTIKAAVRFALNEVGPEEQPTVEERARHAKAAKPPKRRRRYVARGATSNLILQVLAQWPGLTTRELYDAMDNKGWRTSSRNPKGLLGVTLRHLREQGKVQKVGTDWELTTSTLPTLTVPSAEAEASNAGL